MTGSITTEEALEILENSQPSFNGHSLAMYSFDELASVYFGVAGAAIIAYVAMIFVLRLFGGARYD